MGVFQLARLVPAYPLAYGIQLTNTRDAKASLGHSDRCPVCDKCQSTSVIRNYAAMALFTIECFLLKIEIQLADFFVSEMATVLLLLFTLFLFCLCYV